MLSGSTPVLHGKHMPSGQEHTVGYDIFSSTPSTQPQIRRRHRLFSAIRKRYHHHQFGKNCKGPAREPVQELFRPSNPRHRCNVSPPYRITVLISALCSRCGLEFHSTLLPYGDRWRLHRRFFHQTFRLDAVPRFLPLQHRKACHLLRRLFDNPEEFHDHVFE